jgi:Icc-related predicted phosphoesterase
MKILLTADLHCNLAWLDWLETKAPGFDLVCIAGDLLEIFSDVQRHLQVPEIQRRIRRTRAVKGPIDDLSPYSTPYTTARVP